MRLYQLLKRKVSSLFKPKITTQKRVDRRLQLLNFLIGNIKNNTDFFSLILMAKKLDIELEKIKQDSKEFYRKQSELIK